MAPWMCSLLRYFRNVKINLTLLKIEQWFSSLRDRKHCRSQIQSWLVVFSNRINLDDFEYADETHSDSTVFFFYHCFEKLELEIRSDSFCSPTWSNKAIIPISFLTSKWFRSSTLVYSAKFSLSNFIDKFHQWSFSFRTARQTIIIKDNSALESWISFSNVSNRWNRSSDSFFSF